jgi:DNA invertase Pin-like site-specific DNA recombinase
MSKVIGYIRTSTDDQLISLDAQERKVRLYCELNNLTLVDVVVEQASAKNLDRPALQECLDRLGKDADALCVAKMDRLTRSTGDIAFLVKKYFQKFDLISVAEQADTRTPAGKLVLNILISFAEFERHSIGERTSAALKELQAQGAKLGNAPYGFTKKGNDRVVNPEEMKVVFRIKALREEGNTIRGIAAALDADGVKTRHNKSWGTNAIHGILKRDYAALAA